MQAATDTAPLTLTIGTSTFSVHERFAIGSICNIYRCHIPRCGGEANGIFKIARESRANPWVANEAQVLRRLRAADTEGRFRPFLPAVEQSLAFENDPSSQPRQANILSLHEEIRSPEELYSLDEVRARYPAGMDARDVAWIWRRLLSILGFAHFHGVLHGAVLPMHVLIEPKDHKLVLIDWCCAVQDPTGAAPPVSLMAHGYRPWYQQEGALQRTPGFALDVALGARCMIQLLGGDPVAARFPATVDPAIERYFQRCLGSDSNGRPDAWKLLDDFDRLIDALWGERTFRPFHMPPKPRAAT